MWFMFLLEWYSSDKMVLAICLLLLTQAGAKSFFSRARKGYRWPVTDGDIVRIGER